MTDYFDRDDISTKILFTHEEIKNQFGANSKYVDEFLKRGEYDSTLYKSSYEQMLS